MGVGVMLNLDRGAFQFGIGAALAAALLLFSLPAAASEEESSSDANATVLTDAQCAGRWTESEAADTCSERSITAEGSMCRVIADCKVALAITVVPGDDNTNQGRYSNNILVTPNEAAQLHNCNGVLTVGSC